jgi:phage tail-like protein
MSCGPEPARFRLLDGLVGWEVDSAVNIEGTAVDGAALTLARIGSAGDGEILPWFPPPPLARGCGPCAWYLASSEGCLLVRDCGGSFCPIDGPLGRSGALVKPGGTGYIVAAREHMVAVADPGASRVWQLGRDGEELRGVIDVAHVGALGFGGMGELFVAVDGEASLRRYDRAGAPIAPDPVPLPSGLVRRIAVGSDCALFVVMLDGGSFKLYRLARNGSRFEPRDLGAVAAALPPSGVVADDANGFCLEEPTGSGVPQITCFGWDGCSPVTPPLPPPGARYQKQGQLLTLALPSGIPRCRWHRVRIDAEVPPGTRCWVDVATSEDTNPPAQGVPDPAWPGFPTGVPHSDDWQVTAPSNPLDFLIRQPPGQYLYVRLRMTGNGSVTPTVRRVRIDLPRSTSLERLPAVFRETPAAEDFTERFLSLFDATIEQIDRAIVRAPALLDAGGVPEGVLPWLGSLLDLAFDPSWSPTVRRELLAAAPALYKLRGTREGIIESIRLVTGATPAIDELALGLGFGILSHDARLGGVRLFSRRKARFAIGSSALGGAPLNSFGNPDQDPVSATAFRFTVQMPPGTVVGADARARLEQLVSSIKPAHTRASVRVGGAGFVVGVTSMVGVDTMLGGGLPKAIVGSAKLSRNFVIAKSARGPRLGFTVGDAALGIGTRL